MSETLPRVKHSREKGGNNSRDFDNLPTGSTQTVSGWKVSIVNTSSPSRQHARGSPTRSPTRARGRGAHSPGAGNRSPTRYSTRNQPESPNDGVTFQFGSSKHQQDQVARLEYIETQKRRQDEIRQRKREKLRESMAEQAKSASKVNRRMEESYTGAMKDYSNRRVAAAETQSWDALTKIREETKLNRVVERASQHRRSAPLKKAMDRVLASGLEPAIPMAYFRADALYKELVDEEAERRLAYKTKFGYFQSEVRKSVFDAIKKISDDLWQELYEDSQHPNLRNLHEFGVPEAVDTAKEMVQRVAAVLMQPLPAEVVTEEQLMNLIEDTNRELRRANEAVGQAEGKFRAQRQALSDRCSKLNSQISGLQEHRIMPLMARFEDAKTKINDGPAIFHHSGDLITAEEEALENQHCLDKQWIRLKEYPNRHYADSFVLRDMEGERFETLLESVSELADSLETKLGVLDNQMETLLQQLRDEVAELTAMSETTPLSDFVAKINTVIDAEGRDDTPAIVAAQGKLDKVKAFQAIVNAEMAAKKSRDPAPLREQLQKFQSKYGDPSLFGMEALTLFSNAQNVVEQLEVEQDLHTVVIRHHDHRDQLESALKRAKSSRLGEDQTLPSLVFEEAVALMNANDKKHFSKQLKQAIEIARANREANPLQNTLAGFVEKFRSLLSTLPDFESLVQAMQTPAQDNDEDSDGGIEFRSSQDSPREDPTATDDRKSESTSPTTSTDAVLGPEDESFLVDARELIVEANGTLALLRAESRLRAAVENASVSRDGADLKIAVTNAASSGLDSSSGVLTEAHKLLKCFDLIEAVRSELVAVSKIESEASGTPVSDTGGAPADMMELTLKLAAAVDAGGNSELDQPIAAAQRAIEDCQNRVLAQLRVAVGLTPKEDTRDPAAHRARPDSAILRIRQEQEVQAHDVIKADGFQPSRHIIDRALEAVERAGFEENADTGGHAELTALVVKAEALLKQIRLREGVSSSLRDLLDRSSASPRRRGSDDSLSQENVVTFKQIDDIRTAKEAAVQAGLSPLDPLITEADAKMKTFEEEAELHAITLAAKDNPVHGAKLVEAVNNARKRGLPQRSRTVFSEAAALAEEITADARAELEEVLKSCTPNGSPQEQARSIEVALDRVANSGLPANDAVLLRAKDMYQRLQETAEALNDLSKICNELSNVYEPIRQRYSDWLQSTMQSLGEAAEDEETTGHFGNAQFVERFHDAMAQCSPFPAEDLSSLRLEADAKELQLSRLKSSRPGIPQLQQATPVLTAAASLLTDADNAKQLIDLVLGVCASYSRDKGVLMDNPLSDLESFMRSSAESLSDARLRHLGTRAVTAGHACQQYRVLRGEVDNLLNQLALSRDRGNATAMKPALANLIELVNGNITVFEEFGDANDLRAQIKEKELEVRFLGERVLTSKSKVFYAGDTVKVPVGDDEGAFQHGTLIRSSEDPCVVHVRVGDEEVEVARQVIVEHNAGDSMDTARAKLSAAVAAALS